MHDDVSRHYDNDITSYLSALNKGTNWLIINSGDDEVEHLLHQSQITLDEGSEIGLIEAAGSPIPAFGFC